MTGHTFTIAFSGYYWMLESPPGLSTLMLPKTSGVEDQVQETLR